MMLTFICVFLLNLCSSNLIFPDSDQMLIMVMINIFMKTFAKDVDAIHNSHCMIMLLPFHPGPMRLAVQCGLHTRGGGGGGGGKQDGKTSD